MKKHHKIIAMIIAIASLAWFVIAHLVENIFEIQINEPHTK
ncbi:hypothetical protein [Pedobacter sp. Leaf250]|nr:hypothetical protein [Pedobacter sp. Leaf250]